MSRKPTKQPKRSTAPDPSEVAPDYTRKCEVCGGTPILPLTGMCGPCTFGEADTANGNW